MSKRARHKFKDEHYLESTPPDAKGGFRFHSPHREVPRCPGPAFNDSYSKCVMSPSVNPLHNIIKGIHSSSSHSGNSSSHKYPGAYRLLSASSEGMGQHTGGKHKTSPDHIDIIQSKLKAQLPLRHGVLPHEISRLLSAGKSPFGNKKIDSLIRASYDHESAFKKGSLPQR